MLLVANTFGLPPRVLPAIQMVERGTVGLASRNSNGTEDLGVMQINTIWIPVFGPQIGLSPEAMRDRLLNRPCFNIAIAGAILSMHMRETQGDLAQAIGNYHSRTPVLNARYQAKVGAAVEKMFGKPDKTLPTTRQTAVAAAAPKASSSFEHRWTEAMGLLSLKGRPKAANSSVASN
jgi:hypothetical protein